MWIYGYMDIGVKASVGRQAGRLAGSECNEAVTVYPAGSERAASAGDIQQSNNTAC